MNPTLYRVESRGHMHIVKTCTRYTPILAEIVCDKAEVPRANGLLPQALNAEIYIEPRR